MNLSIIIINHNTKQLLHDCLDSIYVQKQINTEIIVVDNASSDGSVEMVKMIFPEVKLIVNDINIGFGKANNQGAKIASGEYLLFLNSDTIMQKSAIDKISKYLEKQTINGAIGFKIINTNNSLQPSCGNFPTLTNLTLETLFLDRFIKFKKPYHILDTKKYQAEFKPDWVSGSCFMIKKNVFDKISGFDENFFLYVEEVDLCYRIMKHGYTNIYFPIETVIHKNRAGSTGKNPAIIFTHQNLIRYFRKHHNSLLLVMVYILFIIKGCIYSITGSVLGIFDIEQREKARGYFLLLLTLFSKERYNNYENSFKQQN